MKALLNSEGDKVWAYVFPKGAVPVKGFSPFWAKVRGVEMEVYLVDWTALTEVEKSLIVNHIADKSGDSRTAVEAEILKNGLPLRDALVSCVPIPGRYF